MFVPNQFLVKINISDRIKILLANNAHYCTLNFCSSSIESIKYSRNQKIKTILKLPNGWLCNSWQLKLLSVYQISLSVLYQFDLKVRKTNTQELPFSFQRFNPLPRTISRHHLWYKSRLHVLFFIDRTNKDAGSYIDTYVSTLISLYTETQIYLYVCNMYVCKPFYKYQFFNFFIKKIWYNNM